MKVMVHEVCLDIINDAILKLVISAVLQTVEIDMHLRLLYFMQSSSEQCSPLKIYFNN